jgi:uncharacterized glyoxalase superfamily protein PhnB
MWWSRTPTRTSSGRSEHDAEIVLPLIYQDYGSRDYTARDPEGNRKATWWTFGTYAPEIPG